MNNKSLWIIGAASVRGKGHVKIDLPNQDAYEIAASSDGSIIAAVVSDGAGSALRAEEGANACVKIMVRCLLDIGENHPVAVAGALNKNAGDQQLIQERVTQGLQEVRDFLDPTGQQLKDYHHTFTGAVLTPTGGFIAQIGDSPAIITLADTVLDVTGKRKEVDFFAKHEVHMPEKGEYTNETSFVTQPDWLSNLRYVPFSINSHRAVLLMSDGAGELAISKGQAFRPFIGTLIHQMLKAGNRQERDQALHDNLNHPQADELTADDKTLLILCHRDWQNLAPLPLADEPDLDELPPGQEPQDQSPLLPERQSMAHNYLTLLPILTFVLGAGVVSAYFLTQGETAQPPKTSTIVIKQKPEKPTTVKLTEPAESQSTSRQTINPVDEKPATIILENHKKPTKIQPRGERRKTASDTAAHSAPGAPPIQETKPIKTEVLPADPPQAQRTQPDPDVSPTDGTVEPGNTISLPLSPEPLSLKNVRQIQK